MKEKKIDTSAPPPSYGSGTTLDDFNSTNNILGENKEGLRIVISPKGWQTRYTVAIMAFFGSVISYTMRINLSMAVVAMTNPTDSSSSSNETEANVCPTDFTNSTSEEKYYEFNWSGSEKGIVLGAFFWGYVASQVPGGIIAEKFGAKWVFGLGILLAAIFQLLTPIMARWGIIALIASRVIQGLGEGVTPPATHALMAQWAPPLERSAMGSFIYAGNQGGTMVAMLTSGAIINADILEGWPGVFYLSGIGGLIWFALWTYLVYSRPSEHPRISKEELHYITAAMSGQTAKKHIATPWREVFRSKAVWAILIAQLGNGWGLYTLLTYMPSYMSSVLNYDIKENSLISALPYFCMLVVALVVSWFADKLRTKGVLSTTMTRKVFNTIGHWFPAVALIGAAYTGCDKYATISLLTIAVAFSGCVGAGYQINHVDIAANHAGVLMGFCNGVSNLAGIVAPYVAGAITDGHESDVSRWRIVFWLAAVIYFVDNLGFLILGTGKEQSWNRPKEEREISTS